MFDVVINEIEFISFVLKVNPDWSDLGELESRKRMDHDNEVEAPHLEGALLHGKVANKSALHEETFGHEDRSAYKTGQCGELAEVLSGVQVLLRGPVDQLPMFWHIVTLSEFVLDLITGGRISFQATSHSTLLKIRPCVSQKKSCQKGLLCTH